MVSQVLTANRLASGDVVYWRAGEWVEAFAEAEVFADEAAAGAALNEAKGFVARNVVVNPYLFEMKAGRPAKEREIIRALGPSIHPELGKQAEPSAPEWAKTVQRPGFAKTSPDKPEGDDDVSI